MSDNTDPFTNGPNQAVFGDPNVSSTDTPDDWKGWDWHKLEAAILGGSGMTTQAEEATAQAIADPTSLQSAADVFYNVQMTLQAVGDDLVQQAKLLAGEDDSPWQGAAANAFLTMIKSFANDIYANINALQDGAGTSLPDQLINNANMLQWAQHEVSYIDSYYANVASQQGANTVDGAVQVHEIPSIPPLMTSDMMQVMTSLVSNYSNNIYTNAVQPTVVSPNSGANSNLNFNPYSNLNLNPNSNLNGGPDLNSNLNLNPDSSLNGGPNLSGSANLNSDLSGSPNLTGSPNLSASPNSALGSPSDLSTVPLSSADLSPGATDSPDYSALNPDMDSALNPSSLASPNLTSEDPAGLDDDDAADLASPDLESSPALTDADSSPALESSPLSDDGDLADGLTGESDLPTESSMPLMPGSSAGSGLGSPSLSSEPSDASGLLSDTDPLSSESPLTSDELGSLSGAAPGLSSAGDGASDGTGMPLMPGMGSGSGAASQASGSEPSDASGLLGDEEEPWAESGASAGDEIGSADGAEAAAPAEQMPFMPSVGGAGQAAAPHTEEPSDASGLLAEADQPWTAGEAQHSEEVGSGNGAVAAGVASAALVGAGAAFAAGGLGADDAGYEEGAEYGDDESEFAEFVEQDDAEHEAIDRVPVVAAEGSDDDLSGWDLAGAAADAALFTLGAWATRRRGGEGEDEVSARIVSTEHEAWLGEDAALPSVGEEADALPGAATWRPTRDLGGSAAEAARMSSGMLRSAAPPKDYDPVAAAEAAAAEAEAAEAERVAAEAAEEEEKRQRTTADLLTQDRDMWGSPKADWDAL